MRNKRGKESRFRRQGLGIELNKQVSGQFLLSWDGRSPCPVFKAVKYWGSEKTQDGGAMDPDFCVAGDGARFSGQLMCIRVQRAVFLEVCCPS